MTDCDTVCMEIKKKWKQIPREGLRTNILKRCTFVMIVVGGGVKGSMYVQS